MSPWETKYRIQLGKVYMDLFDLETSKETRAEILKTLEKIYKTGISLDNNSPWLRNSLGKVYQKYTKANKGDIKKYLVLMNEEYLTAAELDKNNPIFQMNYAYFLTTLKNFHAAIPYYERAVRSDGSLLYARFELARCYQKVGQNDKALQQCLAIYNQDPNYRNIKLILSQLYSENKNFEKQ